MTAILMCMRQNYLFLKGAWSEVQERHHENILNFKDCIMLTLSLLRMSSFPKPSKLAIRGHHQKIFPGPLTKLV